MKTKFSKRILSLFLAVMMVVTTIPMFTITASAAGENSLVAEYLTNDLTSNSAGSVNLSIGGATSNVTWDSTLGAAHFTGDGTNKPYLQASFKDLLGTTDYKQGFTISFYAMTSQDSWARFWELSGLSTPFGNGDASYYLFQSTSDRVAANYPVNGKDEVYFDIDPKPATNIWHHYVVSYKNCTFTVYVDGEMIATKTDETKMGEDWWNNVKLGNLYIGASSYKDDSGFNGYIKKFRVSNQALEPTIINRVNSAMGAYEAQMKQGNLYMDYSTSYNAYTQLSAAFDANYYGNKDNDADVLAKIEALNTAKNSLSTFSYAVANATTKARDDSDNVNPNYATNLLYAPQGTTSSTLKSDANQWQIQMSSDTIALYDGSEIRIPVMTGYAGTYDGAWRNRILYWCYPTDSESSFSNTKLAAPDSEYFVLGGAWIGDSKKNTGYVWNTRWNTNGTDLTDGYSYATTYKDGSGTYGDGSTSISNNWITYSNYLKYVGAGKGFTDGLQTHTMRWVGMMGKSTSKNRMAFNQAFGNIYVIDYLTYKNAMESVKSVLANVSSYREGGLATLLSHVDNGTVASNKLSGVTTSDVAKIAKDLNDAASGMKKTNPNVDSTGYQSLRNAFDYSDTVAEDTYTGTIKALGDEAQADDAYNPGFTDESWKTFKAAYNNATTTMSAVYGVDGINYTDNTAGTQATTLKNAFTNLQKSAIVVAEPTVEKTGAAGKFILGVDDTITIANNEDGATTKYVIEYDDGSTVEGTDFSQPINLFKDKKSSTAVVTATAKNKGISAETVETFYSVYAPVITPDGGTITNNQNVEITYGSAKKVDAKISYKVDDGELVNLTLDNDYTANIKPNKTCSITAYATRTVGDETLTAEKTVNISYKLTAPTFSVADNTVLSKDDTVTISNIDNASILYKYGESGQWTAYTSAIKPMTDNKSADVVIYAKTTNGTDLDSDETVITVVRKQAFTITSSEGENYSPTGTISIVDDSYNGAVKYVIKVDGGSEQTFDYNGPIDCSAYASNGMIEIYAYIANHPEQRTATKTFFNTNYDTMIYRESFDNATVSGDRFEGVIGGTLRTSGSATVDAGAGYKDGNNNSPDWRENVLHFQTNTNAGGPYLKLDSNPLTSATNSAVAKSKGITISFWRHIEDGNGNTVSMTAQNWQASGYKWSNALAFVNSDTPENSGGGYYLIEENGVNSYCKTEGSEYLDYIPENQDPTTHAVGNASGYWVNVVVAIDPNSGIVVYTNGEPHNVKQIKKNGTTYTDESQNTAAYAQELINFLVANDTKLFFNCGVKWEGNDQHLFLDDIRIYSEVLTQTDINNMYLKGDVETTMSVSHDPTNVTVYNLTNGKQVGIEYIEANNIPESQIASREYYSFGTGMTIYHSYDNQTWEVVGDSQGRCGYQNQDLFGAEYTTALATPLAFAKDGGSAGAGYLVWAPHVMYNLQLDTWVYYGSTSSWGNDHSSIFMCVSSDGSPVHYNYSAEILHSTSKPNAIDACVYYDKDYQNLYMLYGSWGWHDAIYVMSLNSDGTNSNITNKGTLLANSFNSSLENVSDNGAGEGGYVVYENGYYYFYISGGQNTGSYVERVFRSTSPDSGFVDITGVAAADSSTNATHGNQIIGSFYLPIYDYLYVSTGHNSVYKAMNNNGETVTLNSVHARPFSTPMAGKMVALPDNALSTRQSEVTGNVALTNQIGYTVNGWPVAMPYQYSPSDTVKHAYTAADIEGTYTANNLQTTIYYNYAVPYTYVIKATGDYTGYVHSSDVYYDFEISTAADGTCLINYYDTNGNLVWEGVLGQHEGNVQLGLVNTGTGEHSWAYKSSDSTAIDCGKKINVTFENLFSFDQFVNSSCASTTMSSGTASFDAVNRTITVNGSGDNYTNHDADFANVYKIPVTPGSSYILEYTANQPNSDAMIFVPNAENTSYDGNYTGYRVNGGFKGINKIPITVPDGKNYVFFRFGSLSGSTTITDLVISNISFYESDRANYRGDIGGYESVTTCGSAYGELPTPTRSGYHFLGWYLDKEYTNQVTADTIAVHTDSVNNLYAKWEAHTYETVLENNNNQFTWTKICTSDACDYSTQLGSVDATAYYAAVAAAEADIKNTAKYTADSISALQTEVNKNKLTFTADNVLTQPQVDTATNNIVYADKLVGESGTAVLVLMAYNINLYYVIDGAETLDTEQSKSNQPYGTTFSFTVPKEYKNNYAVEKWTRKLSDGETIKVGSTNTSIGVGVTGDADYYVHLKKTSASTDEKIANIYLKNSFGKTVGVAYVPISDTPYTVTVSGNTLTINDQKLTAPELTFYNFSNFAINGEAVTNGQEITVSGDITINAIYSAVNSYTITCNGPCTADKSTAFWDEKVTVTAVGGTDTTKWYVDGNLVGYGKTYTFRACKDVTITCKTEEASVVKPTATVLSLKYEDKTISAIGSFSLPEGYTLVNTGVLLKTTSVNNTDAVKDINNYVGESANAKKFIAQNYVKDTKQFIINVHSAKEYPSLYVGAVAYVTYEYKDADGKTQTDTAYSSLVTCDYKKA